MNLARATEWDIDVHMFDFAIVWVAREARAALLELCSALAAR